MNNIRLLSWNDIDGKGKIGAVKVLRTLTGYTLKDSKAITDDVEGGVITEVETLPNDLSLHEQLRVLATAGWVAEGIGDDNPVVNIELTVNEICAHFNASHRLNHLPGPVQELVRERCKNAGWGAADNRLWQALTDALVKPVVEP